MSTIQSFLHFFRPHFKSCIQLAAILLLTSGITVTSPFLYQVLIDKGIYERDVRTVVLMVLFIALSLIIQELLSLGQTAITLRIREGVFSDLRQRIYEHLMSLPQSYFGQQHKGRLLSLLTSDVNVMQNLFLDRLVLFFRNAVVGILILFILLSVQKKMVLYSLAFMPLLFFLYFLFRRKISTLSKINQEHQESLMERLQEDLANVKALQAFSVLTERMVETIPFMTRSEAARRKLDMQYSVASSSTIVINLIGLMVIWGLGADEVIAQQMTIGTLVAISFFFNYITSLFYSSYYTVVQFQGSIPSARRIMDTLNVKQAVTDAEDAGENDLSHSVISMENVTFCYSSDKPILERVNLEISKGEIVGIIGGSGQGKTTLVNLLQRFADPQEGTIAFDGIDIRKIKLHTLRRTVAVIPQEDLLLNDSIRTNIILHRKGITEAQFETACEQAKVRHFAEQLTEGYDTVIGERGAKLSGGQRKRIAIARALLETPYVLILDEATSMLDEETEQAILETIVDNSRDKIVLIITHKKSNLTFTNRVIQITDGKVEPVPIKTHA